MIKIIKNNILNSFIKEDTKANLEQKVLELKMTKLTKNKYQTKFSNTLKIRLSKNNLFFTYLGNQRNHTIWNKTIGNYKLRGTSPLKLSKKNAKWRYKKMWKQFKLDLLRVTRCSGLIIKYKIPYHSVRQEITREIKKALIKKQKQKWKKQLKKMKRKHNKLRWKHKKIKSRLSRKIPKFLRNIYILKQLKNKIKQLKRKEILKISTIKKLKTKQKKFRNEEIKKIKKKIKNYEIKKKMKTEKYIKAKTIIKNLRLKHIKLHLKIKAKKKIEKKRSLLVIKEKQKVFNGCRLKKKTKKKKTRRKNQLRRKKKFRIRRLQTHALVKY